MRVIFAGTPEFSVPCLQALIDSEHEVVAVYTQPDRPAGRGRHLQASAVKQLAVQHHIPVYQPVSLKPVEQQAQLKEFNADVMVVVAYGLLLPQAVLDIPSKGCINVHASLLPRWRGAAPIQRAVMAGDKESGVCIMQMELGLDTGPVLREEKIAIHPTDTGGDLHDRLSQLGAAPLLKTLTELATGNAVAHKQDDTLACYAAKISKAEAWLDFTGSAVTNWNIVKAFSPWPVAYSELAGKIIRIHAALPLEAAQSRELPGTILAVSKDGIDVGCDEGTLRLTTIQLPGAKAMSVADVMRGHPSLFQSGMRFEKR